MSPPENPELLTVIIPCLNEQENLPPTVEEVLRVADRLPMEVEVILVDDGSTDGTESEMEELAATDPRCKVRVNAQNLGLGRSVRETVETLAQDSWVTVVPGDHEILFDSIEEFVAVRDRYDLILGYLQNPVIRSMRRRLASHLFNLMVGWLYGFSFRYLNGMKMYRAWVFQGIEIESTGHAYVAELLAKAILRSPRLRIGEAPFAARGRAAGSSKAIRPFAILRAIRDVWIGKVSVSAFRKRIITSGVE